jgi:hypothetical protein
VGNASSVEDTFEAFLSRSAAQNNMCPERNARGRQDNSFPSHLSTNLYLISYLFKAGIGDDFVIFFVSRQFCEPYCRYKPQVTCKRPAMTAGTGISERFGQRII